MSENFGIELQAYNGGMLPNEIFQFNNCQPDLNINL